MMEKGWGLGGTDGCCRSMASFKSVDSRVEMLSNLFQDFQGLSAIQQYYEAKNGIVKQATEYAQLQGFTSYPHSSHAV